MSDATGETLNFSPASKSAIAELLKRYPRKQGALMHTLFIAQDEFGWLKPEVLDLVARELDLPASQVLATAMFYTMFRKRPHGRYHIQICTNVSCYLRGCDALMDTAREVLGIEPGESTPDGLFTLESVQCLCACDRAPTLQVNKDDHFNVTTAQFRTILAELQAAGDKLGPPVGWEEAHHA